ncbi:MAG: Na+/H+ antiporter NhaA type [Nitrospira sp.]|jgi:NhaA family Na+:H+ antiporter|nr:MAG: Na+/H+ antiporter NhaA type [Nitrospira sp.]
MISTIRTFLKLESAGGILLIVAAGLAMVCANTDMKHLYESLLKIPVGVQFGSLQIHKPLLLWINDGLMVLFFFLVGMELKREVIEGELSDVANLGLPALGALGGMAIPAGIYWWVNSDQTGGMHGWAIPMATDTAFSLGILSLLGQRVPLSLKVFLVSLAIFDDIGAIVIIALFYSSNLSPVMVWTAGGCLAVLLLINRSGVTAIPLYALVGLVMWVAVLKSGVHATLAGVLLALFIPLTDAKNRTHSPLRFLEDELHTAVAFVTLPLFAFFNAGVALDEVTLHSLTHPVSLGITLGLFLGKQTGVFLFCMAGVLLGIARLPRGVTAIQLYGVAVLCGVGFTMSLFIGALAFEELQRPALFDERIGILLGSLLSAIVGYLVLWLTLRKGRVREANDNEVRGMP